MTSTLGLVASSSRRISPLGKWANLLPLHKIKNSNKVIIGNNKATVYDTLHIMQQVVRNHSGDIAKLAKALQRPTLQATLRNNWQWVYDHIAYATDDTNQEQIRTPLRLAYDQKGDCDCFSTFLSAMLTQQGVAHSLRMVAYGRDWQHVYIVVPKDQINTRTENLQRDKYYVLDCVLDTFNEEHPGRTKTKDTIMNLSVLNGVEGLEGKKLKKAFKKTTSAIVKGAATPIRVGVLLAMSTNLFRLAERLGYGAISRDEAIKRKYNIAKWEKLNSVYNKVIAQFEKMEGKKADITRAIADGHAKGVKKHGNNLNGVSDFDHNDAAFALSGIRVAIGQLGTLGEPATIAATTAASGVLATIGVWLKDIDFKDFFGSQITPKNVDNRPPADAPTPLPTAAKPTANTAPIVAQTTTEADKPPVDAPKTNNNMLLFGGVAVAAAGIYFATRTPSKPTLGRVKAKALKQQETILKPEKSANRSKKSTRKITIKL